VRNRFSQSGSDGESSIGLEKRRLGFPGAFEIEPTNQMLTDPINLDCGTRMQVIKCQVGTAD
jgi:hypothetical protein